MNDSELEAPSAEEREWRQGLAWNKVPEIILICRGRLDSVCAESMFIQEKIKIGKGELPFLARRGAGRAEPESPSCLGTGALWSRYSRILPNVVSCVYTVLYTSMHALVNGCSGFGPLKSECSA